MMHRKLPLFVKITPVNPTGVTEVDLGGEIGWQGSDVRITKPFKPEPVGRHQVRHSSAPPSPSRVEHPHDSGEVRCGSVPPKARCASSVELQESIEEVDDEENDTDESIGVAQSQRRVKSIKLAKETEKSRSELGDNEVPLCTSDCGAVLPRSEAGIKNEKMKTCWFWVWNECPIGKPYTLNTGVTLEVGDLFINQFYSKKHQDQALQVWLLTAKGSSDFLWKVVRDNIQFAFFGSVVPDNRVKVLPNEDTYHPKLKSRILSFQPNETRTVPTWIKHNTNRPSRALPLIVHCRD